MRAPHLTALFVTLLSTLSACNDCGVYQYKGVLGTEWCGNVYGTEGSMFEVADGDDWAELRFGHSVPPGEFDFSHGGGVTARVLWEDLESKEPLDASRVLTTCSWTDYGDPFDDRDDVIHSEQATEVTLQGHGGRLNLDVGDVFMREVSWTIACGDGVIRLDAKDTIDFTRLDIGSTDADLTTHLTPPSGEPDNG